MADVEVKYRGQIIRSMSASGTEVLHTEGKYCDDDITIDYTSPGGGGANLQTKSVSYTPDESGISDTILPDPGYDGMDEVDVTVTAIPDTYVGSAVPQRDASDLLVTGRLVRVPAGYYASMAGAQVAMGTEGTPTASKGAVSNHSVDVTPSVTNVAGYISGSTISGTPVTVSASELVSGTQTVTVNDTYDVTNLAEMVVNVSGGGYTIVDSGTFVGNGTSNQTITLGNRVPLKDFYLFVWYDDTDFLYSTEYKIFSFTVFSQGTLNQFVYYDTYGIYTRYASNSTQIDIDNSGVITSRQAYGVMVETLYVRNDAIGVYTQPMAASSPQIRKSSTGLYFMASTGNANYHFMNGETYNWKLVYFGNDPTNDFLTL